MQSSHATHLLLHTHHPVHMLLIPHQSSLLTCHLLCLLITTLSTNQHTQSHSLMPPSCNISPITFLKSIPFITSSSTPFPLRPSIPCTDLESNEDRDDLCHPGQSFHPEGGEAAGETHRLPKTHQVLCPQRAFADVEVTHA